MRTHLVHSTEVRSLLLTLATVLLVFSVATLSSASDIFYGPVQEQVELQTNSPLSLTDCDCTPFAGTWVIVMDWDCDSSPDNTVSMDFALDFTWSVPGFNSAGTWTQDGCSIEMIDNSVTPVVIWTGTFHDGQLSGTYSGSSNGCFTGTPDFVVDEECGTAVEDETWGRVKQLFR